MSDGALDENRLRRLIEVGGALVSQLDLEAVLNRVLEAAREITGARYAALGVLDDRRQELERFLAVGVDDETRAAIGSLPRGRGVLGVLIEDPKPLRLRDVRKHPRSYGFPPGHPHMKSFLGVPILIRGEAYGNLYLAEKEGGEFDASDEQSVVILADWAAVAIENARLYESVEGRRDQLERALRGLEATTEVARALGGETDLQRVLELIVKRGRALVEARWLAILLEERGELVVAATAGELERDLRGLRVPVEGSVSGQVLRSLRPERVADVSSRVMISPRRLTADASTALFVPLAFRGRASGVLVAADKMVGGPEFTADDEHLMLSFAASAATAVHTAKSVAEERLHHSIEASEQERRRWARELHDETLQGLGGLQVLLSSALQRGSGKGLETAALEAIEHIGSEIEKLRSLITELRPAALDEIGLQPAIESLAERTASIEGFAVDTEIDLDRQAGEAPARLAPELESTIYRLVQEALTNVAKHARAEYVRVEVLEKDGAVEVAVQDDGVGFDPEAALEGFGLTGMRERVELAGGRLKVSSSPGNGTAVRAVLPAAGTGPPAEARHVSA